MKRIIPTFESYVKENMGDMDPSTDLYQSANEFPMTGDAYTDLETVKAFLAETLSSHGVTLGQCEMQDEAYANEVKCDIVDSEYKICFHLDYEEIDYANNGVVGFDLCGSDYDQIASFDMTKQGISDAADMIKAG